MAGDRIPAVETIDDSWVVEFSCDAYSLESVKRAFLKLSAVVSGTVRPVDGKLHCDLHRRAGVPIAIDQLREMFLVEVTDEDLRERVAERTEGIRNLILAHAFSKTPFVDEE